MSQQSDRVAVAVAIATFAALVVAIFGVWLAHYDATTTQSSTPPAAADTSHTSTDPPPPSASTQPPSTAPTSQPRVPARPTSPTVSTRSRLTVDAQIGLGYAFTGPTTARACPTNSDGVCVQFIPHVRSATGQVTDCYLSWTVRRAGGTKTVDSGNGADCSSWGFYIGNSPLPAGRYELHMTVRTNGGQSGTGTQRFNLVPDAG